LFLFDKSGKLVYHGAIDDNPNGPDKVTRQHAQLAMQEMVGWQNRFYQHNKVYRLLDKKNLSNTGT
jgi:hypothetical protein